MSNEDRVALSTILHWLENYDVLKAGDIPPEAIGGNSGQKSYDGVKASRLNMIMLDKAIDDLPIELRALICSRYKFRRYRRETLKLLGISVPTYYEWTKKAIRMIYKDLNGIKDKV
ncbi:hypothetical protein [Lysinibacillus sp. 54212]|uniref:hypothetical protein n=1 Tax=Lysinibacillus sp. 54212 TaxID=3119829 RepID=UPI002FCACE15